LSQQGDWQNSGKAHSDYAKSLSWVVAQDVFPTKRIDLVDNGSMSISICCKPTAVPAHRQTATNAERDALGIIILFSEKQRNIDTVARLL
jgi:hypothetical protein